MSILKEYNTQTNTWEPITHNSSGKTEIPLATETRLGGIIAKPAVADDNIPIHITPNGELFLSNFKETREEAFLITSKELPYTRQYIVKKDGICFISSTLHPSDRLNGGHVYGSIKRTRNGETATIAQGGTNVSGYFDTVVMCVSINIKKGDLLKITYDDYYGPSDYNCWVITYALGTESIIWS